MKLIETHCHGKDCERKNNCYRYVYSTRKAKEESISSSLVCAII